MKFEEAPRPEILISKQRRRNESLGMKVWFNGALNLDCKQLVEFIEIGCPKYELTSRGPELVGETEDV